MLGNSFFITNASNPDTPAETWTLIYSKTTPGNYSYNAGWGKYKIEISGGGGSGSSVAIRKTGTISNREQNNGYAAQKNTVFVNTLYGTTKVISGKVASGGKGSETYASTSSQSITLGAVGTGYQNGSQGTSTSFWVANAMRDKPYDIGRGAMAGGSGGGSTSLLVNGTLQSVAPGGSGGSASLYNSFTSATYGQYAGTWIADGGKRGGPASNPGNHNGSAGGAASYAAGSDDYNKSGDGVDGYVKIYISNLKPEPL